MHHARSQRLSHPVSSIAFLHDINHKELIQGGLRFVLETWKLSQCFLKILSRFELSAFLRLPKACSVAAGRGAAQHSGQRRALSASGHPDRTKPGGLSRLQKQIEQFAGDKAPIHWFFRGFLSVRWSLYNQTAHYTSHAGTVGRLGSSCQSKDMRTLVAQPCAGPRFEIEIKPTESCQASQAHQTPGQSQVRVTVLTGISLDTAHQ